MIFSADFSRGSSLRQGAELFLCGLHSGDKTPACEASKALVFV